MKNYLVIFAIFIIADSSLAQQFSTYYHQRKSFFESLPNTKGEIIFLGNSITDGCNWAELLNNKNVKNRGISGDITLGILFRLDEVISSRPAKIFLMIGVNDLARNVSVDSIAINYRQIVSKIKKESPETLLFLQSILPVNPNVGDQFSGHKSKVREIALVNSKLKEMAIELDLVYLDLHTQMTDQDGYLDQEYTNDGLHLIGPGYQKWKDLILQFVD